MIRAYLLSSLAFAVTAAAGAASSCADGSDVCSAAEGGLPAAAMLQARSNILASSVNTGSNAAFDSKAQEGYERGSFSASKAVEDAADSSRGEATAAAEAAVAQAAKEASAEATERAKIASQAAAYLKVKQRRMEYVAHIDSLEKAMAAVNASTHPSQMELDNMFSIFADHQAASQDKCPSLLLEAKHQLNVIHEHIHELAIEINVTESSLVSEHIQIETTYEQINNTHAWKVENALKCKAKREENWKMYWILKAELLEMHQIANPSFQANYDYSAWALKHDFSAKTHTIVSTSSYAASSTSTGSHSNTATATASGISTSGFMNSATSGFMNTGHSTGHSTGISTGFGDTFTSTASSGYMNGYSTGFSNQGYTSGFMNGYNGQGFNGFNGFSLLQKNEAGESDQEASLLQEAAEAEDTPVDGPVKDAPARVAKTRAMVQRTKSLAAELSACMAQAKESAPATGKMALVEEGAEQQPSNPSLEQEKQPGNLHSYSHSSTFNTGSGSSNTGIFGNFGNGGWNTGGVYTGYGYGHGTGSSYSTGHSSSSASTTGQTYHSQSSYHSSFKTHSSAHSSLAKYTTSSTGTWGASYECQLQKQALQVVYIRAYIELTRLLAQYEVIIHEHTCDDWVLETEGQQEKILEAKVVKMTTTVATFHHKLEQYHIRLQAAYRMEVQLRAHIVTLTTTCGEMDATVSSLDKVRDAIHVMGVCPGLGRLTFNIPRYTGQILDAEFDTLTKTDAEIDAEMNALCANSPPSVDWASLLEMKSQTSPPKVVYIFRAAETSEIMLRTIQDLPVTNTATIPLMGPCPNCDGNEDDPDGPQHAAGYFRVCWDPDAALSATTKREDCTAGRKAVMCVAEQTYNPNATLYGQR